MHGAAELHDRPSARRIQLQFDDYLKYVVAEDIDCLVQAINQSVTQHMDLHVEYRILLPDDAVRWIEARDKFVRNELGEPVEMIGVNIDITQRKKTEISVFGVGFNGKKVTSDRARRSASPIQVTARDKIT